MQPTVYLAGPITGLSYDAATDWRKDFTARLRMHHIKGLSPMRGKEYLSHVGKFTMDGDKYQPYSVMSSNRGIITRDRFDATRCTVLLVNLLGAEHVSIGTMIEIGWADGKRIPIVGVMEKSGNPHEHGMVLEAFGYRVETLDEALHLIVAMLA